MDKSVHDGGWVLLLAGLGIGVLAFSLYALLASNHQFGYEGEHAALAKAYVERSLTRDNLGRIQPRARGGILDVGQYVPFYLLAQLISSAETKAEVERFWYVWVHPFWNAWTVVMIFYLAWMLYRRLQVAIACALLAATGTVLLPYSKFGMETQQTLWTTAMVAGLVAFRARPTMRSAGHLAFPLAMVILTKITGITVAFAGVGVLVWWLCKDKRLARFTRRHPCILVLPLLGFAVGLGLLLVTNKLRYGAFCGARYPWGDRPDAWPFTPERIWAFLASPNKNVFLFSPVLILTLPYWCEFFRRFRHLVPLYVAATALFAFHLSMNTWVDERWWFSRLHFLVPLLVLPLGIWWEKQRVHRAWQKAIAAAIVGLAMAVQLLGSAVNYTALAYVVHPSPELTRENLVWNPQYNHLRFNAWALWSWWKREIGGSSVPFVAYRHYLPAAPPPGAPPRDEYNFKGFDEHDFFLLKELQSPTVPLGSTVARTAIGLAMAGMLAGSWCIVRAVRLSSVPLREGASCHKHSVREQVHFVLRKWAWRRKWRVLRIVRGKA